MIFADGLAQPPVFYPDACHRRTWGAPRTDDPEIAGRDIPCPGTALEIVANADRRCVHNMKVANSFRASRRQIRNDIAAALAMARRTNG